MKNDVFGRPYPLPEWEPDNEEEGPFFSRDEWVVEKTLTVLQQGAKPKDDFGRLILEVRAKEGFISLFRAKEIWNGSWLASVLGPAFPDERDQLVLL